MTAGLVFLMYLLLGFAPFGDKTLTYKDGQAQYVDLFCWYRDVLSDKAGIDYSLSKTLGGPMYAVFAYYLASPLNLLVLFFKKSQMALCMNIIFACKVTLASVFASIFLIAVFKPKTFYRLGGTALLAVSYALSQYTITQSSNLMWLDGVYMLPLILLGVHFITNKKSGVPLILSVALSLIFNWYTGVINCMFAVVWLVFEVMSRYAKNTVKITKKTVLKGVAGVVRFGICMALGIALSVFVLLPSFCLLSDRSHGSDAMSSWGFIGFLPSVIQNYSIGMSSAKGGVSLFAGSLVLIGAVLLFVAGTQKLKEKIVCGAMLLFSILMYFWNPLVYLFSIFRNVESFWYRYSYLGIFVLVYLSALFFLESGKGKIRIWMPPAIVAVFMVLLIIFENINPKTIQVSAFTIGLSAILDMAVDTGDYYITAKIIFPVIIAIFMVFCIKWNYEKKIVRACLSCLVALSVAAELLAGFALHAGRVGVENAKELKTYVANETALLNSIDDNGIYRIKQDSYHSVQITEDNLYNSYNEPLAFGFESITSFVSDPEEAQGLFLEKLGYPFESDTITVATAVNPAADSLLGVKYYLLDNDSADTGIAGLTKLAGVEGFKGIYENPFTLPQTFIYTPSAFADFDSEETNPFEYANDLYSELLGETCEVFVPVDFEEEKTGDSVTYTVTLPEDYDFSTMNLYCNIVTEDYISGTLDANGSATPYSLFLAPSVVYVPLKEGDISATVTYSKVDTSGICEEQFYILDTETLDKVTKRIKLNPVTRYTIEDGYVRIDCDASAGEMLFISVPCDGMDITLNGKECVTYTFGGCLTLVPLTNGENIIEMTYVTPLKTEGIVASLGALFLLIVYAAAEEKLLKKIK